MKVSKGVAALVAAAAFLAGVAKSLFFGRKTEKQEVFLPAETWRGTGAM